MVEDGGGAGGGGDDGDGAGREGGAGGEGGAGDGGKGGGGAGAGGGEGEEGEHHPSWRRTAASPHRTAPDASRNQEVAREEGGEGGPAEHWRLPQLGGQLLAGCSKPLFLRHGDSDSDQNITINFKPHNEIACHVEQFCHVNS